MSVFNNFFNVFRKGLTPGVNGDKPVSATNPTVDQINSEGNRLRALQSQSSTPVSTPLSTPMAVGAQTTSPAELTPLGTLLTKGVPQSLRGVNIAKLVIDSAKKYKLDPAILSGLLKKESSFSEQNVFGPNQSNAGAQGIAQFTPVAQRDLANSGYGQFNPYDPNKAVDAAGAYISRLADKLDKYGPPEERVMRAMAAYNGGETAFRAAWNRAKTITGKKNPVFADVASFLPKETQQYVPAILSFAKDTQSITQ